MRRIGVLSASDGAGGRFVASNLACYLAGEGRRPAVLELGKPGLYDALGMDKRFAGRTFFPQGGPPNVAAGVNWSLIPPDGEAASQASRTESADGGTVPLQRRERGNGETALALPGERNGDDAMERFYERLRRIDRVEGDVVLCVLNGMAERERNLFLRDMDVTLLVFDPLPSKLLASCEAVKLARDEEKRVAPIVNKMNGGVKKHELCAFLGVRTAPEVPLVPAEEIYRAEYACRVPYEAKAVAELLRPSFRRIMRSL